MPLFSERSQPKFDSYRLKVIQTVWLKKLPDQNVKIFWSKHWFITIKRSPQTLAVWPRIRVSHLYTYMLVQVTNNPRAFEYLYCWKILKSNFRFFLESTFLFRCRAQFYYCLFSLLEVKPSFLFFSQIQSWFSKQILQYYYSLLASPTLLQPTRITAHEEQLTCRKNKSRQPWSLPPPFPPSPSLFFPASPTRGQSQTSFFQKIALSDSALRPRA